MWFAPNLGSGDLLDLFRRPDDWPRARAGVDVLQLYAQHLASDAGSCPECGPNLRQGFVDAGAFDALRRWHVQFAVETSALKEWGCTAEPHLRQLARALRVSGGADWIVLDEPRAGADACGLTPYEAAPEVAQVIEEARRLAPRARVGLVEPWPAFSVDQLERWLDELEDSGARVDFLHLDVDRNAARVRRQSTATALAEVRALCRRRGLAFGVVLWGQAPTDAEYARDVRLWTRDVTAAVGWPDHAVVQSWSASPDGRRVVPRNLPETAADTHTRLLLDVLRMR